MFKPQAQVIAMLGIPWYNVIGNHDINMDAPNDVLSDETFENHFGPSYYSFDYGKVHFIALDNIEWVVEQKGKRGRYRGGLGAEQMEFVRNDLAMIPDDQLVVLMMHIPLIGVRDRVELYRMIERRPFCMSISGHTHHHEHVYIEKKDGWRGAKPHHHVINVTVSGSWWGGAPDERGIPHTLMADGAPNGYSVIEFDGQKYRLDFKVAGRSADYQLYIHLPEEVKRSELPKKFAFVNVFNGSDKTKVEMRIGNSGSWVEMKKSREIDPHYAMIQKAENGTLLRKYRNLPNPKPSSHLWKAALPDLPAGVHLMHVRTSDQHGRTFQGARSFRVIADSTTPGQPSAN